jgi:para-nitrobenzyl esterase
MDPAISELVEGRMFGRFKRMMPGWDMTDTVKAYREVLSKRGIATTPPEIFLAIMTARVFWIPTTRMLEAQARRSNPAYSYMFTWKAPFRGGMFGAFHGIDSGFLWSNYHPGVIGSSPVADTLSRNMQDAWLAFAHTGTPTCPGLGKWPVYGEHRETMLLGEQCRVQEAPYEEERHIWDSAPDSVFKWG